jgi:putative FmdB family regulatory protein
MPIYEYLCEKCSTTFEMLRPMSRADETTSCPDGHPGAKRRLSLFARPASSGGGGDWGDEGNGGDFGGGDFGGGDDFGGSDDWGGGGGGCACGGACTCG